ncbi:unnamed protein product [Thelazia callipaeda]|uniref:SERTA domain-containing protein n=1 Tax=Thelazia callipaeda TaxID=103827 RepID=A0A158RAR7_THECL|nr:unnamed protein product [Thelazia callipaeda]
MVLLVAPSASNYTSSLNEQQPHNLLHRLSSATSIIPKASGNDKSAFMDSVLLSNHNMNNSSAISCPHAAIKLGAQLHLDEAEAGMGPEDVSYSSNSSMYSNSSSIIDTSLTTSLINERRRAMLDLSISKIQTMNASNVAVSLRKSLLIYNTMKSLQRDLETCNVFVCDSLIERGNEVSASDVDMLEADEVVQGAQEKHREDLNFEVINTDITCWDYGWPWGTLIETTDDTLQDSSNSDEEMNSLTNSNGLFNSGSIWSSSLESADSSAFIDDYLGMLGAWEDENYNPLTNCNLTQAEIMNMFRLPAYHLNSQVVSQA